MRMPAREIVANQRLVKPEDYEALIERLEDPAERLTVRLQHDSFLRPSDLANLRLSELAEEDGILIIRKATKKAKVVSNSILMEETAGDLRAYVKSAGIADYLFEAKPGKPRHRTWPNHVFVKHGWDGSPRDFRRTGATNWSEDLASLMAQGGWSDPKTILTHYRRNLMERHLKAFEKTVGIAKDRPDEDIPGYG